MQFFFVISNTGLSTFVCVSRYIDRFEDRMNEIKKANETHKKQGRHGELHSSEEDAIKMVNEREMDLFTTGRFGERLANFFLLQP